MDPRGPTVRAAIASLLLAPASQLALGGAPLQPAAIPDASAWLASAVATVAGLSAVAGRRAAPAGAGLLLAAAICGGEPTAVATGAILGAGLGAAAHGLLVVGERRWLVWPALACVVTVAVLAWARAIPAGRVPGFPHADKVLHFALAALVSLAAEAWLRGRTLVRRPLPVPISVAAPLALAAAEEAAQSLVPHRTADLVDLLCDAAGFVTGWAIARAAAARGAGRHRASGSTSPQPASPPSL